MIAKQALEAIQDILNQYSSYWLRPGIICEAITNENDNHRSELLKLCLALATGDDSNWSALSPPPPSQPIQKA